MLKVGIIGCGKIADQHAEQIVFIPEARLVGACDSEPLMADQFCQRFDVTKSFAEAQWLIEQARPDVVHITTPPRSHYPLGKLCLEAGCHVYIEKPFTIDVSEARELVALAKEKNLK